ncbi:hypothetical protein [uncultured Victivallis sp.]|uniref:hypothetical protein n=1 Tax=uncultured Victivallis sp. TaxID=354118 RepID=UPI0025D5FCFB|nr:hypothetical protein [uncultured Victivallis sp.]
MRIRHVAIMVALVAALLPLSGRADQLDRMVSQLDRLERSFWRALPMKSDSDFHRATEDLLSEVTMTARSIQSVASRAGSRHPNLTAEMNRIQTIFEEIDPASAKGYRFNFKYTSFRDYRTQFRKDLPEEKRKQKLEPTMGNVSVDDYQRWLDEVVEDNVAKIGRQRGGGGKTTELLREHTTTFFTAIATMRVTLIKYRQEKQLSFPE